MALRELLANFGISVDSKELQKADGLVDAFKGKLETAGKALAGAFAIREVKEFLSSQIELGAHLQDVSARLGVGTDELQRFQYAAKLSGVEADGAATALGFFNKNMGEAIAGSGTAAQAFAGLRLKDAAGQVRPLADVVGDFADKLQGTGSQAERTALAMQVFGRAGAQMLPLLQGGSKEVKALFAEFDALGGGMSEDFVAAASAADDQLDRLHFAMVGLKSQIAVAVLPAFTWLAVKATRAVVWLRMLEKHTYGAKTALLFLGSAGVLKAIAMVGKLFGLADGSVLGLLKSLVKFGPIVALIGALYLIFDDVFTLMHGGDSVLGKLLDKFYGVGASKKFVEELQASWDMLEKSFKDMLPVLADLGKALLDAFVQALPYIIEGVKDAIKVLSAFVRLLAGAVEAVAKIPAALKSGNWEQIGKVIDKAGDSVFGKGGVFDMTHETKTADLPAFRTPSGGLSLPAHSWIGQPQSAPVTQTNQNRFTINVAAGENPTATGRAVAGAVKDATQDATYRASLAAIAGPVGP